jgi:hypothetical protein
MTETSIGAGPEALIQGDVLGVSRGSFDHYGILVRDGDIIDYAPLGSGITGDVKIRKTSAEHFLRGAGTFWRMHFPTEAKARRILEKMIDEVLQPSSGNLGGIAGKFLGRSRDGIINGILENYHLYTPAETQERASSRLGEAEYSLSKMNCEHFAFWCKTGLATSQQVDGLLLGGASLVAAIFTGSFRSRLKKILDPDNHETLAGKRLFEQSGPIPAEVLLSCRDQA